MGCQLRDNILSSILLERCLMYRIILMVNIIGLIHGNIKYKISLKNFASQKIDDIFNSEVTKIYIVLHII